MHEDVFEVGLEVSPRNVHADTFVMGWQAGSNGGGGCCMHKRRGEHTGDVVGVKASTHVAKQCAIYVPGRTGDVVGVKAVGVAQQDLL